MTTIKFIGTLAYQAEVIPKRGRTPRRMSLTCPAEFLLPVVQEREVVRDAVVATGFDGEIIGTVRHDNHGPRHYLGHDDKLFKPIMEANRGGNVALSLEHYLALQQESPNLQDRIFDPLTGANDPEAICSDDHFNSMLHRDFVSEEAVEGELVWSNKAASYAIHQQVCERCLLGVGNEIWQLTRPPTWSAPGVNRAPGAAGFVLLETDHSDQQSFRLDKHELATRFAMARFGEARTLGELTHADERFLGDNELRWLLLAHSETAANKGIYLVPYWHDEAVEAYLTVCRARRLPDTLKRFGVTDPASMLSALETLRRHLGRHSMPLHLRRADADIAAEIDALMARLELDPTLRPALTEAELVALGECEFDAAQAASRSM